MNNRYCPQHGDPYDPLRAWQCPVAEEDGPPETETCHWFIQEIDRRLQEVTDHGNYFSLLPNEPGQPRMMQEYRDHEPYGEPRQLGT